MKSWLLTLALIWEQPELDILYYEEVMSILPKAKNDWWFSWNSGLVYGQSGWNLYESRNSPESHIREICSWKIHLKWGIVYEGRVSLKDDPPQKVNFFTKIVFEISTYTEIPKCPLSDYVWFVAFWVDLGGENSDFLEAIVEI